MNNSCKCSKCSISANDFKMGHMPVVSVQLMCEESGDMVWVQWSEKALAERTWWVIPNDTGAKSLKDISWNW